MELYYIIFLIIALFSLSKQRFIYLSFVLIFFIMSFIRWERGTDWGTYYNYFIHAKDGIIFTEPGYKFLNILFRNVSDNYTYFLFILATIIFGFKYNTLYKFSSIPILTLLGCFAFEKGDIFFVRQTIAQALCIYALNYIIKKDKLKFIIAVLFASLFHASSLIFLIAYWIFYKKISTKKIVIICCLSILGSVVVKELLNFLGNSAFSGTYLGYKMVRYLNSSKETFGYGGGLSIYIILLKSFINRGFLLTASLVFLREMRKENKMLNGFINFYVLSFLIFVLLSPISITLTRMANYYEQFQVLIIPYFLNISKNRYLNYIVYILIIIYMCLKLKMNFAGYYDEFVPYKTIFNK